MKKIEVALLKLVTKKVLREYTIELRAQQVKRIIENKLLEIY